MRDAARAVIVLFALILSGCKAEPFAQTALYAKDYDQGCATVADCVPVLEGPAECCRLDCPNAAIALDALAMFKGDYGRAAMCPPNSTCPGLGADHACEAGRIACTNGRCELLSPPTDGGNRD